MHGLLWIFSELFAITDTTTHTTRGFRRIFTCGIVPARMAPRQAESWTMRSTRDGLGALTLDWASGSADSDLESAAD